MPANRPHGLSGTELVTMLAAGPGREDRLRHVEVLPPRSARTVDWPAWVPDDVAEAYRRRGIARPWRHQVEAAELAHAGAHVVLATGTASGKSLAYHLPALTAIRESRGPHQQRGATVLYLTPTKALAQDQASSLQSLGLDVRVSTHDGDSGREQRDWSRDHAEYLLTNPDMLHVSMLPGHQRWASFWRDLRYVVVDECHHYRGMFGSQVAQVLRRLRRVAAHHGAAPTFVLASATVAEPETAASRLTGLQVQAVTDDASPRGQVALGLWEPPLTSYAGENGAPVRRAASSEVADLLADLVTEGVRTLAFVRSRRGVESVALTAAELLTEVHPELAGQVAAYRGGYLPEERREIEDALRSGRLTGLAATNALELGIDVHGLDAVLLAGFPGTRAALWQQLGRAGREGQDAVGVLVARDDPLDTYLVAHPEALLGAPVEASVFDPDNPYVLRPHLCAAAFEVPLTEQDLPLFGPTAAATVETLTEQGMLRRRPRGWFWTERDRPADAVNLRSGGGGQVSLIEGDTGRVIGTVDGGRAHAQAHRGAVYVHRGETWLVDELDLDEQVAVISRSDPGWSTSARETTALRITGTRESQRWGECRLTLGEVAVTHQVVSYLRRREPGGEVLGEEPLDLPARTLPTVAVWWTVPPDLLAEAGLDDTLVPGAAHAAEHCAIGLLPLFATCDRWDIGGVSTALHPDTGQLSVFVYDGHPGGAGFAERGFHAARAWLTATRDTIEACECAQGCPSCVQSPKCGNQNNPLEKDAARRLLELLLSGAPAG
ncbi:DEAD/DEAH box helicase [Nocardioides limicola]|uniref:DEAD/DEAH box helicase n=1 Tax=Nocardioides limicola TaxID=2803368 RepID=UPI001EEFB19A|nr:DEAD/DEAH box helicase [Nocardioides sp. DJM-14]